MRIVAGRLGGRQFDSPGTFKTHPMSDKMRGALFNILGDITDLTVLDPFAGSGALSFEAISRGATQAMLLEQDRAAQRIIAANIQQLALGRQAKLISASAGAWLQTREERLFNLVLCDPPYNDPQINLIKRLAACVEADGLLVLSLPVATETPVLPLCTALDRRNYGDGSLAFYRKTV